ncbi:MAG: hypothetical protein AB7H97_01795 [Pseudobdellovibrionaceae bacterium]
MRREQLANSANYDHEKTRDAKNKLLSKALDSLADLLGIEFGSLTVHFHKGKRSPRIEIKKTVVQDVE